MGDECDAADDCRMNERERLFWIGIRKAMIEFIRAIEIRYGLESAIVTNAQRKALHRGGCIPGDGIDTEQLNR